MLKITCVVVFVVCSHCLPLQRVKRQQVQLPLYPNGGQLYSPYTMGHSRTAYNPFQFPLTQSQPPLMPFQHVLGFTQTVDWGSQAFVDGALDIPIVKDGYYYPGYIAGDLAAGTPGFDLEYGHAINPVNPFDVDFASLHYCIILPERCPHAVQTRLDPDLLDPRDEFDVDGMDSKRILIYRPVTTPKPKKRNRG